jgi:hypothetical protein
MSTAKPIEHYLGQRHGKLVVIGEAERYRTYKTNGKVKSVLRRFICKCDCGSVVTVYANNLRGTNRGCGCGRVKHGLEIDWKTGYNKKLHREHPYYTLWKRARDRARNKNLEFNLSIEYVKSIMVNVCPVFGYYLVAADCKSADTSPSLDRIDSSLGYVEGNVWVISTRANRIKSDATLEELKLLVATLEAKHGCGY